MAVLNSVMRAFAIEALPTLPSCWRSTLSGRHGPAHRQPAPSGTPDLAGEDDRLLVVIGPCSIHDPVAALDYAGRLARLATAYEDSLQIVMRAYFEKPRTTVGWKGLVFDPHLDGSNDINRGLHLARQVLLDINGLGLATATEFLDTTSFLYLADLVSWGAIGARTTESQVHRQLASALPCPVGFKNGTDGNIRVAIDAIQASTASHLFTAPGSQGGMVVIKSEGNPDGHIILRGGTLPNYHQSDVAEAADRLTRQDSPSPDGGLQPWQQPEAATNQLKVAKELCRQLSEEPSRRRRHGRELLAGRKPETGSSG
jgi:3-deoxy-7-phosphoheptulonate synthase